MSCAESIVKADHHFEELFGPVMILTGSPAKLYIATHKCTGCGALMVEGDK